MGITFPHQRHLLIYHQVYVIVKILKANFLNKLGGKPTLSIIKRFAPGYAGDYIYLIPNQYFYRFQPFSTVSPEDAR